MTTVTAKLFKLLLQFGNRYINDTYAVTLYINMGRLMNAERELNEMLKSTKDLLVQVNLLRLQNACRLIWAAKKWRSVNKREMEIRARLAKKDKK